MAYIVIGLFILIPIILTLCIKPKKYGCDCEDRDYELVRVTKDNKYYKCTICGTEDHLVFYRANCMGINDRMWDWYFRQCIKDLINK